MLDQETTGSLVKSFHLTLNYLKIYPPTSQMVGAAFDTFFKTLQGILEKNESFTLSENGGRLLVDGKEPESREVQAIAGTLLKLLAQKTVTSLTFRAGLTREELMELITSLLRRKREEFPEFPHLMLDQTVYVAMVKGEDAVVKIREMVRGSGGEIVGLITTLRESYDLIDQIPDGGARAQAQKSLAQELSRQDPAVLRDIFERELPQKIEQSGLKSQLLGALSQEKIQSIFGDIASWFEDVKKKESSDFAAIEQLEKLKKFMQTVLSAPAARDIPRQFFEEMLRKGLLEQLPEWFSMTPGTPATVYEVERLLDKPAAELLDKATRDSLPQLVEKLCQIADDDLIAKLLDKLLENVKNPAPKLRLPAVQTVAALYEILQAQGKEHLLRYSELPLLEAARVESSPEIHLLLSDLLRQRVRQDLLHGEYDLALRGIDLLRKHSSSECMPDARICAETAAVLQRLVGEISEILIADLKSDSEKKRLGSFQILAQTGDRAVEPLIRVIKESADVRSRRLASLALKNLGEPARRRFTEELNLGLTADEMRHVVEAAGELGAADMLEHLASLLRYPDPGIKKEVFRLLARIDTSASRILLIEQLKDPDCAVATEAARLLGESRCTEAVPGIIALLQSTRCAPVQQEQLCVALSAVGDPRAVPVLVQKLRARPGLFTRNKDEIERLRIRAAWALRRFPVPEAEKALTDAAADKTGALALTARESLAQLQRR